MLASVKHEDFYIAGSYVNPHMGLYLGWTSHSCQDSRYVSFVSRARDIIVVVSGEVRVEGPSPDWRQRISDMNPTALGEMVSVYEDKGEGCFPRLNGCFAGVLVDLRLKRSYLFNDRYGIERVFVHEMAEDLFFASEAKALLAVVPATRSFDQTGLGEFLACGCTLGTRSLYRSIGVLPGASLWKLEDKIVASRNTYFRCSDWSSQEKLEPKEFLEKQVGTLTGIVRRLGSADYPVGISLTGGFDSRLVVACLAGSQESYPCYTFGSMFRETRDVKVARHVASECGYPHTVLTLGPEFLKAFRRHLERAVYLSDGYLGLAGSAELYLNSLARGIAPIRLTGNYGSELLRGVRAFKAVLPQVGFLERDYAAQIRRAVVSFHALESVDPVSFTLFHQAPNRGFGRLAIEKSQLVMRTPFVDNALARLMYQRPRDFNDGARLYEYVIKECRPGLLDIETDRGGLGRGSRVTRTLRGAFRGVMVKAEYFADRGMPDWLAACTSRIPWVLPPKLFLGRDKFHHFRLWLATELAADVRDLLLSHTSGSSILDKNGVESMVRDHLKGRKNYSAAIDMALTLATTERLLMGPLMDSVSDHDICSSLAMNNDVL